ncbi:MAG: DUF2779 domain-containing protein [Gemmatimonadales bacterium]|jgi:hypothetical protein
MSQPAYRLSKSRYTYGLQCHKQLWWRVHEPDASELVPGPALRARFAAGTRIGEVARSYVPGGVLITGAPSQARARVAATEAALAAGAPAVYEATFVADEVYAAVDILERTDDGFALVEVKSSTHVRDQYVADAAIQAWIARRAGVPVRRVEIMHLNRGCTYPDLSDLFTRADITGRVAAAGPGIPAEIARQLATLAGPLPDVTTGPHCSKPYDCPFLARCWPPEPAIPAGIAPEARSALADALEPFAVRLAFLDFETVQPPIPVWQGCHPFDLVPAQFSCDVAAPDGTLVHHEWLAEGPGDPRPALAEALVRACEGAEAVVAYWAAFERACLHHLAAAVPALARQLEAIAAKLVDLHPVVKRHVTHPGFRGSFSLKSVLPVLVEGLGYETLAVREGEMATNEIARLLFEGEAMGAAERAAVRRALLEYCAMDTLAMVKLLERLRSLAGRAA